jgi:hypothetical protein
MKSSLNFEQKSLLNQYHTQYKNENIALLQNTQAQNNILHDLLNQLLIHQPEDVFEFVKEYFSYYRSNGDDSNNQSTL